MPEIEPLILADGTVIYPASDEEEEKQAPYVDVPRHDEAVKEVTKRRRRLNELPEVPQRMNLLAIILTYHLLGVSNEDIASVLEIPLQRVTDVLLTDAFVSLQQEIVKQILENDSDEIRTIFRRGAKKAAKTVEDLVDSSNAAIALAAAKDILDRDGHRPSDVVEHRHSLEGGLTIQYVQKKPENVLDGVILDEKIID